jgi:hypothetical protein
VFTAAARFWRTQTPSEALCAKADIGRATR